MKKTRRSKPLDWKRILVVILVLGIAGYQWYTQNIKSPPADKTGEVAAAVDDAKYDAKLPDGFEANSNRQSQSGNRSSQRSQASNKDRGDTPAISAQPSHSADQEFLVSIGGKNLQSPAGLVYGMGGGGEHRVEHVMNHAVDDPGRPSHGVFDGDQDSILKLLDAAYEMVKNKSKYVETENSRGNTAYVISMGRKIGYEGGQKGKRSNHKSLRSIKLVLDGNRVITAYPYR